MSCYGTAVAHATSERKLAVLASQRAEALWHFAEQTHVPCALLFVGAAMQNIRTQRVVYIDEAARALAVFLTECALSELDRS